MDGHVAFYSFYSINYNMNIKIVFSLSPFTTTPVNLFIYVHVDGYRKWVREEKTKKLVKKVLRPKKDDAPFQNLQKVPNPLSVSHYPIKSIHQDATRRNEIIYKKKEKKEKNKVSPSITNKLIFLFSFFSAL